MKPILILFLYLGAMLKSSGQYQTYTPTNAEISYPKYNLPIEEIKRVANQMQNRYDQNLQFRDKLINWIFDLKSKTNDKEFLSAMDANYKSLRAMDGKAFQDLGEQLDVIK